MKKTKKETTIGSLIAHLKEFEKYDPNVMMIPVDSLENAESHNGGKMIPLNDAYIFDGLFLTHMGTDKNPTVILTGKKILKELLEQHQNNQKLSIGLESICVTQEGKDKIEQLLKEEEK